MELCIYMENEIEFTCSFFIGLDISFLILDRIRFDWINDLLTREFI